MTLRIGIVGAGANTCSRHLPGFLAIPGVAVVAVANRTRASGERVARRFALPRVFDDWRDLVADDGIDAVCIGTWPDLHAPVTLAALAKGKHVLTEARMATDLAEARRMHAVAGQSDRVAMVVPAPFFLETEPLVLDLIAAGELGELLEIHVRGLSGVYDPQAPINWRQRRDRSGQNILTLGIFNETVRRYAGDEVSVTAEGTIFTRERSDPETGVMRAVDVPESLAVAARMKSGATAVYHLSAVSRWGGAGTLELHGTRGAVRLEPDGAWVASGSDDRLRRLDVPESARGGWRVERDFVDAIREGKPVTRTSFADGVKYMEFTEAVQESLREGRRIDLPLP